ncbi:hypothetical protein GCM10023196_037230 [Actinoallomurus vinaceus]|uniref:Phosphoadenosine phosphosulphate reductase domain-containing protein n=1 Tax=Actinoallomurus vinaceus TaxID=1080074 RepID=A0ABP8UCL3_9ACTN
MSLGRKQGIADAAQWRQAIARARELVPDRQLDDLLQRTVDAVKAEKRRGRVAYAWSGGKDSQALRYVMQQAGVHECVLGITVGLEWPAMLRWVTDNMPPGLHVATVPLDLPWLAKHPDMLFPQGAHGPRWFTLVQHRVQRDYFRANRLDLLALGRRRKDGNYVGPPGEDRYTNRQGVTRWSPLADWTHEQVFALMARENLPLPPCYDWPRGFQVGTGAWPARQWTTSVDRGFEECWTIDPDVIRQAAPHLPAAADWMRRAGVT